MAAGEQEEVFDVVEGIGRHWERVFGGMLFICVPPEEEYDPTDIVA